MNASYLRTVALLLDIAPHVFTSGRFAMKGGTALNLFVQEMPRLSVDIDVVYVHHETERSQALHEIAAELVAVQQKLQRQGLRADLLGGAGREESKILVRGADAQVKVEVNHVFRGTVLPIETRRLTAAAEERFETGFSVPTLAVAELYGGKLVAAMDRQHSRDLFDVIRMYEHVGLTEDIVECFVAYLAAHNRPIHEVLFSRENDLREAFNDEFLGMTAVPVSLSELESIRTRLHHELPKALADRHRRFLLTLASGKPDWTLMTCRHLRDMPGIRWKLLNLEKLKNANSEKFRQQFEDLSREFDRLT